MFCEIHTGPLQILGLTCESILTVKWIQHMTPGVIRSDIAYNGLVGGLGL